MPACPTSALSATNIPAVMNLLLNFHFMNPNHDGDINEYSSLYDGDLELPLPCSFSSYFYRLVCSLPGPNIWMSIRSIHSSKQWSYWYK